MLLAALNLKLTRLMLVNIEEIKPKECEHDIIFYSGSMKSFDMTSVTCQQCHKKLRPSFVEASE